MFDSLLFSVLLSPLALGVYRLSYHAVVKWRLERYVIFAPWVMLQEQRGVLVLDAEKDDLEREIDELRNSIIHGDCVEAMGKMPEDSVDSIVTDPPYGIAFMGKSWDEFEPREYQEFCEKWGGEALRVLKPGAYLLAFSGTRTYHRMVCGLEDAGFEIKDQIDWFYGEGMPKNHDIGKAIQKEVQDVEPEEIKKADGVGFMNEENDGWHDTKHREIMPQPKGAAENWNGWGTALKPAHEPIVLARKPKEGTYAENVLEYGVGGLNVDGCRIGDEKIESGRGGRESNSGFCTPDSQNRKSSSEGRWPTNVILDPVTASSLDDQRDGASKFFYCPKPRGRERNAGLENLESKKYAASGGAQTALDEGRDEYDAGREGDWNKIGKSKNPIRTLKPINLLRYLVRLVTPPDGTVLDPFAGSGTTACACVIEGFDHISIEQREVFAEKIALKRVEYWAKEENWDEPKNHEELPVPTNRKNRRLEEF